MGGGYGDFSYYLWEFDGIKGVFFYLRMNFIIMWNFWVFRAGLEVLSMVKELGFWYV